MIDMKEFEALPCTVNKETLTKVCHISKRTALYFLQSGLIPSRATGKKTRCYLIEKEDILRFISDREKNPSKYRVLQNWCRSRIPCGILRQPVPENRTAKRYYTSVLLSYPELLTRSDVACLTGYSPNTVSLWISKGELKRSESIGKVRFRRRI